MRPSSDGDRLDPVFLHTRREAIIILIVFCVALVWSVTWCYLAGYHEPDGKPITTVLGIPSWAFWGIGLPWLVVDLFTIWFCLKVMKDDPLEAVEPQPMPPSQPAVSDQRNV